MRIWVIFPFLLLSTLSFRAQAEESDVVGARPGYVFDVDKEKNQHDQELVLIEEPAPLPPLKEKLFNEKVTKDIQQQYEQRFGFTPMEQTMNAPQKNDYFIYNGDPTVSRDQYIKYQRSFGEYVARKVGENQADLFFKNSSSMKGVYQFKDTLSNASIKSDSGYKLNYHYNLSGNTSEVVFENPYHIETKVIAQLGTFRYGHMEQTVNLGYNINTLYRLDTYYKFYDGLFQLVATRKISPGLSASLTSSQTTRDEGPSIRQSLMMVGVSWTQ